MEQKNIFAANIDVYVLDTNAIIYYLEGDRGAVALLEYIFKKRSAVYISAITETELLSFSGLTAHDIRAISAILSTVSIIPVDSRIARTAGFLRRSYGLDLADAVIAATTFFTGALLITRNIRDFKKIPDLRIQSI